MSFRKAGCREGEVMKRQSMRRGGRDSVMMGNCGWVDCGGQWWLCELCSSLNTMVGMYVEGQKSKFILFVNGTSYPSN